MQKWIDSPPRNVPSRIAFAEKAPRPYFPRFTSIFCHKVQSDASSILKLSMRRHAQQRDHVVCLNSRNNVFHPEQVFSGVVSL